MAGTPKILELNVNAKMDGMENEPEPVVEETAIKAPIPKPKSQGRRLKNMTIKKGDKKKKLV